MLLKFLNELTNRDMGKTYSKPDEILSDLHLSASQKYMVLEAMLNEARDEENTTRQNEILKAQINLKKLMG